MVLAHLQQHQINWVMLTILWMMGLKRIMLSLFYLMMLTLEIESLGSQVSAKASPLRKHGLFLQAQAKLNAVTFHLMGNCWLQATLWCTESFTMKSALEEHTQWITDVRFSSNALRLATSSANKTVRVWDADNPGYSIRTFTGHSTAVMSLDFHPSKKDLLCSCDNNSEIRYWGVKNGSSAGVYKGGATQLRFQPCSGRILAAAADNLVSLLDVETQVCRLKLQVNCEL